MSSGKFFKESTITFFTRVLTLFVGIGTSIILARVLGPRGKGYYSLAMLLPSLVVTLGNFGVGSATVYYVARRKFEWEEILGNNLLLSAIVGGLGVLVGLTLAFFFRNALFPGVPRRYLLLAVWLIPLSIFYSYIRQILLGAQCIKAFNYTQVVQTLLFFLFIVGALVTLKAGVVGAITASLVTWLIVGMLTFYLAKKAAGGLTLKANVDYVKQAITYGVQAHLSNVLAFLNYRVDMFLINGFLNPAAVGFYSIGVGLAEKLWMISFSASTVLFPRVAAETDEERRKDFTPLVARTVLWLSALGALLLFFFSRWIVLLLYSKSFLPAVGALQALLFGIIALSGGRVMANDIAGRGHPSLNIYTGLAAVITNLFLNLLWIPHYGIAGAAWASTVSYTVSFLGALFFYCRLSGNHWTKVIIPQRGDWEIYFRLTKALVGGVK